MNSWHGSRARRLAAPVFTLMWLAAGCSDSSSKTLSDAATSSTSDAATRTDAGAAPQDAAAQADATSVVEDDASISLASAHVERVCDGLCTLREQQGQKPRATCMQDCSSKWPAQSPACRQVASELADCVHAAGSCTPIVQCCYNEAGRFGDNCPLSFQQ